MNKVIFSAVAFAVSLASSAALAQQKMDSMKGMDMNAKPAASAPGGMTHHATGTVKKVDAKSGVVTIAHGPVKTLNWSAMSMGFQVNDKMLLEKLKVGQKVDFDFEQNSKGYVVTSVK